VVAALPHALAIRLMEARNTSGRVPQRGAKLANAAPPPAPWVGAVPAAGQWATRRGLPLAGNVGGGRGSGERRTALRRPGRVAFSEEIGAPGGAWQRPLIAGLPAA
jgi:hypothetical protein